MEKFNFFGKAKDITKKGIIFGTIAGASLVVSDKLLAQDQNVDPLNKKEKTENPILIQWRKKSLKSFLKREVG